GWCSLVTRAWISHMVNPYPTSNKSQKYDPSREMLRLCSIFLQLFYFFLGQGSQFRIAVLAEHCIYPYFLCTLRTLPHFLLPKKHNAPHHRQQKAERGTSGAF